MQFSFLTIHVQADILYKAKSSKFYAYAFPIDAVQQVTNIIQHLKIIHPKASHFCYAYRLGIDKNNFRCNDDGEPNNTAGKPILGQIDAFQLSDILVVVVRYFGGTKLGVSGLIDAYKESAKAVLKEIEVIEVKLYDTYKIETEVQYQQEIYRLIKQYKGRIDNNIIEGEKYLFVVSFEKSLQLDFASICAEMPHLLLK